MRKLHVTCALLFCGVTLPVMAEDAAPKNPHAFATLPEGKTLPESVMRARIVYGSTSGNGSSYDSSGAKQDAVVDVKATGGALVVEYGISDRLSLQVQQDFVGTFESTVKSERNWEAAGYTGAVSSNATLAALQTATGVTIDSKADLETALSIKAQSDFKKAGACTTIGGDCGTVLASGAAAAVTARATIAATLAATDASILESVKAKAARKGGRGPADTTVGVLYDAFKTDTVAFALAAGLRYPTGNRDRAASERPTGRGLTEFGGRFNLDVTPIPTLAFAWQNQSEVMAMAGKYKVAGDEVTVTRSGVRNVGFLMAKPSLAGISESLAFIAPRAGLAYDYDSEERRKVGTGTETSSGARGYERKLLAGVAFNGFDFGIPAHLDIEYRKSSSGQNISAATDSLTLQLKGFYKF